MSSDSDSVSKELRSSEYEGINQAEIERTIKTSKTNKTICLPILWALNK